MASQKSFLQAVKDRRTYYQLNKEAPISDQQIVDIAREAVLHVPSSFNSQSARLVVLLNKEHDTFWDFVLEVLKPVVPEDQFPTTEKKVSGFRAAYGTVSPPSFLHAMTPRKVVAVDMTAKFAKALRGASIDRTSKL